MVPIQIIECANKSSQGYTQFAFGFFLALPFQRRRSQPYQKNRQQTSEAD